MAEGFDPGSHALRWADGSTADLIGLLHEHASVLQELHVEGSGHMAALFDALPSCVSLLSLILRGCREMSDSLGRLAALQTLEIAYCDALTRLPESLGQLAMLTMLRLEVCRGITGLPESLGQLAALTTVKIFECPVLTGLPESLGQLAALTTLHIRWCRALTSLPESIGRLAALTALNLCGCRALTALPDSVCRLAALRTLDLYECSSLTGLPESLGQLAALADLDLSGCREVTVLPLSFAFLPDTGVCLPPLLAFPPEHVVEQGMPAVKAFLLTHLQPLKILLLILGARRHRLRTLPPELWEWMFRGSLVDASPSS